MRASGVMTRSVTYVGTDATLEDAWSLMTEFQIRHLPVVEGGQLVGILSDRDLIKCGRPDADGRLTFPRASTETAMTPRPTTCLKTTSVSHLAKLMLRERIDCVPITDGQGKLTGIVTSADLLELLCDSEPALRVIPFEFTLRDAAEARAAAN